jgi:hypothetical protein
VQWFDETGIVVTEERRPTFGLPDVTFALAVRQPKAGNYRVVGYAGDKVAVEYRFVVTQ